MPARTKRAARASLRSVKQLERESANLATIIERQRLQLAGLRSHDEMRQALDAGKVARSCIEQRNERRAIDANKLIEAGQLAAADHRVVTGVVVGLGGEGESTGLAVLRVETSLEQLRNRAELTAVVVVVPAARYRELIEREKEVATFAFARLCLMPSKETNAPSVAP